MEFCLGAGFLGTLGKLLQISNLDAKHRGTIQRVAMLHGGQRKATRTGVELPPVALIHHLGQTQDARGLYRKALDLKPNEPSVLSNLGMSYVLEGDLKSAETYLRSAASQPGADSRVRQNLALAVGLQGRFDEAEQIASQELSPEQAQANVSYLRSMLTQQNAWNQIKADDKAKKN